MLSNYCVSGWYHSLPKTYGEGLVAGLMEVSIVKTLLKELKVIKEGIPVPLVN